MAEIFYQNYQKWHLFYLILLLSCNVFICDHFHPVLENSTVHFVPISDLLTVSELGIGNSCFDRWLLFISVICWSTPRSWIDSFFWVVVCIIDGELRTRSCLRCFRQQKYKLNQRMKAQIQMMPTALPANIRNHFLLCIHISRVYTIYIAIIIYQHLKYSYIFTFINRRC